MKNFKKIILILTTVFSFIACSKEDETPKSTLIGQWEYSKIGVMNSQNQEELQRLYEYPESFDGILTDVKRNLLKDFELDKQKNSFWTSWIRNSIFNQQEDWKYLNNYAQTVNSITAKDISSFAKSLLSTTPMIKAVLYPKN